MLPFFQTVSISFLIEENDISKFSLTQNTPKYLIPLFVHLRPSGKCCLSRHELHHKPRDLTKLTFPRKFSLFF